MSNIDSPAHYNTGNIEVIDAIEDWQLDFRLGNVVKYVARAQHKGNQVEDLRKAHWYLKRVLDDVDDNVLGMAEPEVAEATQVHINELQVEIASLKLRLDHSRKCNDELRNELNEERNESTRRIKEFDDAIYEFGQRVRRTLGCHVEPKPEKPKRAKTVAETFREVTEQLTGAFNDVVIPGPNNRKEHDKT